MGSLRRPVTPAPTQRPSAAQRGEGVGGGVVGEVGGVEKSGREGESEGGGGKGGVGGRGGGGAALWHGGANLFSSVTSLMLDGPHKSTCSIPGELL